MTRTPNIYLIVGGVLSSLAAVLHLGCIVFGGSWYRFLGAGEQMARMADAGSSYPAKVTALIAAMLLVWSAYAFSGAGVIPRLPLLRPILCAITAVYLLRGFLFFPLMRVFPGNSLVFWLVSGAVCALIGIIHVLGLRQAWRRL